MLGVHSPWKIWADLMNLGEMRPGCVMSSMAGHVSKTQELVLEALHKKLKKDYEPPTVLVIAFEDLILKNDDTAFDLVAAPVAEHLAGVSHPFIRVFLVGTAGHLSGCVYDES